MGSGRLKMETNRNDSELDWVEQALKADARAASEIYIADDGFTAALMARLPAPAQLPAWRTPVIALLWLILGGAVVAALPDAFYDVFRAFAATFVGQPLTLSKIAVALALLGTLTWGTLVYAARAE
jgi:hypothetical protein